MVILTLAGIIGFFVGYWTQQLSYAIFTVMGASAFAALLILPPWPFLFRKHPLVWQTPIEEETSEKSKKKEETKKTK
uniref:Signal peptidase complex subunit 1 n=1 Tax=Caenorhabditis japonica TaxID=281687 RepID=A0A8R1DF99_CAEJA